MKTFYVVPAGARVATMRETIEEPESCFVRMEDCRVHAAQLVSSALRASKQSRTLIATATLFSRARYRFSLSDPRGREFLEFTSDDIPRMLEADGVVTIARDTWALSIRVEGTTRRWSLAARFWKFILNRKEH